LLLLACACVVPMAALSLGFVGYEYQRQRAQVEQDTVATARALMAAVDDRLQGTQRALLALAHSPVSATGHHERLQADALLLQKAEQFDGVMLVDAGGVQVMNSAVPYGSPLPAQSLPPVLEALHERAPIVLDLFRSPRGPAFSRSERTGWSVVIGIPRDQLAAPGWRAVAMLMVGGALVLAGTLALAWGLASRLHNSVEALGAAVRASGHRARLKLPAPVFQEALQLGLSFKHAHAAVEDAHAALARSEARTRTVLDTATDAIVTADEGGRIVLFNRAAEAMFGRRKRTCSGSRWSRWSPCTSGARTRSCGCRWPMADRGAWPAADSWRACGRMEAPSTRRHRFRWRMPAKAASTRRSCVRCRRSSRPRPERPGSELRQQLAAPLRKPAHQARLVLAASIALGQRLRLAPAHPGRIAAYAARLLLQPHDVALELDQFGIAAHQRRHRQGGGGGRVTLGRRGRGGRRAHAGGGRSRRRHLLQRSEPLPGEPRPGRIAAQRRGIGVGALRPQALRLVVQLQAPRLVGFARGQLEVVLAQLRLHVGQGRRARARIAFRGVAGRDERHLRVAHACLLLRFTRDRDEGGRLGVGDKGGLKFEQTVPRPAHLGQRLRGAAGDRRRQRRGQRVRCGRCGVGSVHGLRGGCGRRPGGLAAGAAAEVRHQDCGAGNSTSCHCQCPSPLRDAHASP
jgi:PAS domain-containing protein